MADEDEYQKERLERIARNRKLLQDLAAPKFEVPDLDKKKRKREYVERSVVPTAASSREVKRQAAVKSQAKVSEAAKALDDSDSSDDSENEKAKRHPRKKKKGDESFSIPSSDDAEEEEEDELAEGSRNSEDEDALGSDDDNIISTRHGGRGYSHPPSRFNPSRPGRGQRMSFMEEIGDALDAALETETRLVAFKRSARGGRPRNPAKAVDLDPIINVNDHNDGDGDARDEPQEAGLYLAERVLDKRAALSGTGLEYLVKFEGFADSDAAWLHVDQLLPDCGELIDQFLLGSSSPSPLPVQIQLYRRIFVTGLSSKVKT